MERKGDRPFAYIISYREVTFLKAKFIFDKWLPGSPYELADAADFEYYEADSFDPVTHEGEIDIYVPVEGKLPS